LNAFIDDLKGKVLAQVASGELGPDYKDVFFDYLPQTVYLGLLARHEIQFIYWIYLFNPFFRIFHLVNQRKIDQTEVARRLTDLFNAEKTFIMRAMVFLNEKVAQLFRTQYLIKYLVYDLT